MSDERIDFSQLEPPDGDALRRAIGVRVAPLLAERRGRPTIIQLGAWWRPVAAAAVIVAIASTAVLALAPGRAKPEMTAAPPTVRLELARALGVPSPLAQSLTRETPPSAREFLRGLGASR